jgi:hypothetical protein
MEVHLVPKKLMPQETILDGHMNHSMCPRMSKSMDDVVIDLSVFYHAFVINMILNKNCFFVCRHWSRHIPEGAALESEWNAKFSAYEKMYKEEAAVLKSIISGELPSGWEKALPVSKFQIFKLWSMYQLKLIMNLMLTTIILITFPI